MEAHLKARVEKAGGRCIKLNPAGYVGIPDRLVVHPDWFGFVEVKRPKGGRYSALQDWWASWLEGAGIPYARVKSIGEVDDFVEDRIARRPDMGDREHRDR